MSRLPNPYLPLSNTEQHDLALFLQTEVVPPQTMQISAVNGLLTSVLIGPRPIAPAVWMDCIWAGQQPRWIAPQQAELAASMLIRHLNSIALGLACNPPKYAPLTYVRRLPDSTDEIVSDWCYGFLRGIQLDSAGWAPIKGTEAEAFLGVIIAFQNTEVDLHRQIVDRLRADQHDKPAEVLSTCVLELQRFWLKRRTDKPLVQGPSAVPSYLKAARNDPCPCGSTRKFKNCCGRNHTATPAVPMS